MVRNIKYIKNIIEAYFKKHKMINDLKFGDTDNLSIYSDLNYPLTNYEYIDSQFKANNLNTARYSFAIMDLSNDENSFDVIANMTEIGNDFLKYLEVHDDIEIEANISLIPFEDSFQDRVSGVTFSIIFNIFRNNCGDILPIK